MLMEECMCVFAATARIGLNSVPYLDKVSDINLNKVLVPMSIDLPRLANVSRLFVLRER